MTVIRPYFWRGMYDLGPLTIPPRIRGIALVDRSNGNTYWVNINTGTGAIVMTTPVPSGWRSALDETYPANEEPYLSDGTVTLRLYSTGGVLTVETLDYGASSRRWLLSDTINPKMGTDTIYELTVSTSDPTTYSAAVVTE